MKDISFKYSNEVILNHISLDIYDKEFITLLGPSGCGKTTTLRIIAGFETPQEGEVYFDGEKVNDLPPYKRNVNTVFQKYALFPHLNVFDNVAFGLKIKKLPKKEIEEKVKRMLAVVDLKGYEKRPVRPSPAVSSSVSRSRARWYATQSWYCWTSRSARWI